MSRTAHPPSRRSRDASYSVVAVRSLLSALAMNRLPYADAYRTAMQHLLIGAGFAFEKREPRKSIPVISSISAPRSWKTSRFRTFLILVGMPSFRKGYILARNVLGLTGSSALIPACSERSGAVLPHRLDSAYLIASLFRLSVTKMVTINIPTETHANQSPND